MLLLWLGGFWRTWLPLLAVSLWLAVALANATAPGAPKRRSVDSYGAPFAAFQRSSPCSSPASRSS